MFNCQICGKTAPPKTPGTPIVVGQREKQYLFRQAANRPATWKDDKTQRMNSSNDNGGQGWEAAVTKLACPACVKMHQESQVAEQTNAISS